MGSKGQFLLPLLSHTCCDVSDASTPRTAGYLGWAPMSELQEVP